MEETMLFSAILILYVLSNIDIYLKSETHRQYSYISFDKIFSKLCLLAGTLQQLFEGKKNAADRFLLQVLLQHLQQVCKNRLMDNVKGTWRELRSNVHDHQAEYFLINLRQERKGCYFNAIKVFLMEWGFIHQSFIY